MPMQPSGFLLDFVKITKFNFEIISEVELIQGQNLVLNQGFKTAYKYIDDTHALVILQIQLVVEAEGDVLYECQAELECQVSSDNIKDVLLKNVVAIQYSYLRPLVAQMTVFSKVPPLDLPPVNLSHIELEEMVEREEE